MIDAPQPTTLADFLARFVNMDFVIAGGKATDRPVRVHGPQGVVNWFGRQDILRAHVEVRERNAYVLDTNGKRVNLVFTAVYTK